jgi:hypothetical protein
MKKITNDILWDFADELLPIAQQKEVAQLLENNPALQKQLDTIRQQKTLFASSKLEQPDVDFGATLLSKWSAIQAAQSVEITQPTSNLFFLKVLFTSFMVLCISLLCIVFSKNTAIEPFDIEIPNIEFEWSKLSFILVSILAMLSVQLVEKAIEFHFANANSTTIANSN